MRHPDASLAAYVDGTATARERATAESHLATCEACRRDVRRARAALKAAGALPDLAAPHVDVAAVLQTVSARRAAARRAPARAPVAAAPPQDATSVLSTEEWAPESPADAAAAAVEPPIATAGEPLEEQPSATVTELPGQAERAKRRTERDRAWQLRVAQFALGAAAILVAIVLFVGLRNDTTQTLSTGAPAQRAASPSAAEGGGVFGPAAFDEASLNNYAQTLVAQINGSDVVVHATATPAEKDTALQATGASTADRQLACLQKGTGLVAGNRLYQLLEASYNGRAAYVGAFLSDVKSDTPVLLLLVVSVDGCDNLRILQEPLQPAAP